MITNLDMDCLRTFVTIVDAGSFSEAALRVGRTASAVSLQISRLEEQVGTKLFQKSGRRMIPSHEGEQLLVMARQILGLNDQIIEVLGHQVLSGEIGIGIIQDFADTILSSALESFRRAHPRVRISTRVDRTKILADAVDKGAIDLAIGVGGGSNGSCEKLRTDKMLWLGGPEFTLEPEEPVPLIVFEPPCSFREAAISSLNKSGRKWEIVFTSPSLSGLKAAIEAGLGVTVRTNISFEGNLHPLPRSSALPKLPCVDFALYSKPDLSAPADRLREIVIDKLSLI
jgi:DNA-binding transcriptional LysR family regulator